MQHTHERRVSGVRRVPVERIVDVCGTTDPASAFQGRSLDVSGRGMQVRAAHLPELRAPVVVRFREQEAEVIAEGEVVWRRACANGGEFGIRFTALDSRSVQALKALCGVAGLEEPPRGAPGPSELAWEEPESGRAETDHDTDPAPPAALGVRLHIAGLTSPLQARVKGQDRHSLEVGSSLDFLRVGSSLQIEDLGYGGRREACIEAVAVSVDEKSRVPELVVSLRYAELPVPQPAARSLARAPSREPELDLCTARELDDEESEFEQRDSEPPPLPRRVSPAVQRPASASSTLASERLARDVAGRGTAEQAVAALDAADQEDGEGDEQDEQDEDSHSQQADAEGREPAESSAAEPAAPAAGDEGPDLLRERLDGVLGGVSVAARVAGVQVVRLGGAASRGARWLFARAERAARAAERPPVPRRRTAAPPRSALRSGPLRQAPQLASQRPRPSEEPALPARSGGSRLLVVGGLLVAAAVLTGYLARRTPLGMPVPAAARVSQAPALATAPPTPVIEPPAPVSVPPAPPASVVVDPTPAGGVPPAPVLGATVLGDEDEMSSEPSEPAPRAAPRALDQSFAGSSSARAQTSEFGQGRLRSPVLYRLRLDQPAEGLRGERTPTGFEVTLAGRRVMESGASITKRDERIARVATHNTGQGTRVSFRFKDTIPGYKVRLRKDYIEFLISAP